MNEFQICEYLKENNIKMLFSEKFKLKSFVIGIKLNFNDIETYTDKTTFNRLRMLLKRTDVCLNESTRRLSGEIFDGNV